MTALGVVRSLGRSGLAPVVVARHGDLVGRSRWAVEHLDDISESDDPSALVAALEAHGVEEAVLFPCSDTWAQAVARMPDELRSRYPASISQSNVLDLLVDKELFATTLDRHDVPHPRTRAARSVDEIRDDELDGYFLKPSNSQRFNSVYGDKAYRFSSRDEAAKGLRLMEEAGVHALVQQYIPGSPDLHYFVDGYVDRDGIVRAIFVRRRTRMYPVSFGNSSHMTTVAPDAAQSAVRDLTRLFSEIGFHGVFSAEFKRDPRDGAFKLLEVNARPWWYIGFAADCGVDVSMLSYRDALGLELTTIGSYPIGARCVLFPLDFKAFLYERQARGLTFRAWLRSVMGARSAVFAWSDPRPGLALFTGMMGSRTRRLLGRSRRRGG